jgi:uncharacterized surface protein with fasciclin (FAS1) repeats
MKSATLAVTAFLQLTAVSAKTYPLRKQAELHHASQQERQGIKNEELLNNHPRNLEDAAPDIAATSTIYEIAGADANFSTLVSLVEAAGLSDVFQGEGPLTLFGMYE